MSIKEIIKLYNIWFDTVQVNNTNCLKIKSAEEIEANQKKAMELINKKSKKELLQYIIDNEFTKNTMQWL